MYVRVVRFNDVDRGKLDALLARVRDSGGPPEGVASTGIKVLFDEGQRSAVVLQEFASAADMESSARVFEAMDPGDTPGKRVSVDACELKLELHA